MPDQANHIDCLKPALVRGDEDAFGELLDAVGPRLRRAAVRMLASEADADDAVQEVFVGLFKSRHRMASVENLNAYLFATLHRAVSRSLKKQAKQPDACDSLDQIAEVMTVEASNFDEELLDQAVQQLSAKQREVIVLKTDAQLTFAEIGKLLSISTNTAASRYRYGLENLRLQLRNETC